MYLLPLGPLSHPIPSHPTLHPTLLGHHRAPRWASVLHSRFPWWFYTWKHVYIDLNLLIHPTRLFPPRVSTHPFSISVSLFLPCKSLHLYHLSAAAAAAKLLQLCPTLCDPIDGSPPGSPIPGILQARVLEWGEYHLSSFHIYALIYDICFSLWLYFTLYDRLQVHLHPTNDPVLFLFNR